MSFDGSLNISSQLIGVGNIVRDNKGEMVAAFMGAIEAADALLAELQALLQVVSSSRSFAINHLTIERDYLILLAGPTLGIHEHIG